MKSGSSLKNIKIKTFEKNMLKVYSTMNIRNSQLMAIAVWVIKHIRMFFIYGKEAMKTVQHNLILIGVSLHLTLKDCDY